MLSPKFLQQLQRQGESIKRTFKPVQEAMDSRQLARQMARFVQPTLQEEVRKFAKKAQSTGQILQEAVDNQALCGDLASMVRRFEKHKPPRLKIEEVMGSAPIDMDIPEMHFPDFETPEWAEENSEDEDGMDRIGFV